MVLTLAVALLFPVSSKSQNTRNVLVLYNGNATHPADTIVSQIYRDAFGSAQGSQLFEEYLDEDRLDVDEGRLAELLHRKYVGKKMDLVIADAWPALRFILHRGEELWPGTPKVFYFVDSRELPPKLPPNMTGVAGVADYGAILDLALRLSPNTRHVFYVGGTNAWEEAWRTFAEQDFKRFADRVDVTYLNHLPLPELLERLGRLPVKSLVIYSELLLDASGHVYVPGRVCPLIASASNAPVYAPLSQYVGCGIVGGVVLDVRDLAMQTARLGLRVLEHGSASGIPVETTSTKRAVVDWRQLQRWHITERNLPPGTIVRFRSRSLWEQYKWYVLAGLAAIVAEFVLIVVLIMQMRRRKKADFAIKNLSGRLINAGEEERKRIARELHDDIGQRLSLLSIELDGVERELPANGVADRDALRQSLHQINELVTDVHNLSHQLHSSKLQMLGLGVALTEVCQRLARQHEMEIQLTTDNIPSPVPEDVALCFYRVAQEALNNSVKHSGSARAEVRVAAEDGTLRMTIKDYGTGFDPDVAINGLGLATMRERLRLVEGELVISSKPGGGTEVMAQAKLHGSVRQTVAA
jgi:signal transduction histidine kinase